MAGDYSRKRFNPENHYQGVLRQQGRVDLDADFNEQIDILDRRWRAETIDVVGRCGVPSETPDAFKIQKLSNQVTVGQGRIYVDGLLAENHGAAPEFYSTLEENYGTAALPVAEQPYSVKTIDVTNNSVVYLDVWRREVTHLQEPSLIEPAVNIDTTTRYQTAWQVKALPFTGAVNCQTPLASLSGWPHALSSARLSTSAVAVSSETDPCLVPPTGGYRGLENHFYRVEVHGVTTNGAVLVKWSRENAHVATNVLEILNAGTAIRVDSLGRDDVLRFKNNDWVEITSDSREFAGEAGDMRQVTVSGTDLTLSFAGALSADLSVADHLRVIRWDQSGSALTGDGLIALTSANPSFVLEYGIQAELTVLAGGSAHVGDYWCFAARTADADIERLDKAPPTGVNHHFCKLAIINGNGVVQDCRPMFPALTELTSLFYVSGDGQEGLPGQKLPKTIQVGVAFGKRPVSGAIVRFHVVGSNGNLSGGSASGSDINVLTDPSGVASCDWTLDGANPSQQVEAMLADGSHLPVRFNATLSQPGGAEPGIHVKHIMVGGDPLQNDTEVSVEQLTKGITISCDDALFKGSVLNKPVCFVTLEMPFPLNDADIALWSSPAVGSPVIGFQPLVLAAAVTSEVESIFWQATNHAIDWLGRLFLTFVQQKREVTRVLARLTVKGNFIWSEKNPNLYLDGEVFGVAASGGAVTAVKLPSGDNHRGGDLEMWFWLIQKKSTDVKVAIKPETARVSVGEKVEFTVAVEGTDDKRVDVVLDPKEGGELKQARENVWTYTAPKVAVFKQVKIIATSSAAPAQPAIALVNIEESQQEIGVTIAPDKANLEPGDSRDFKVTVQGGDQSKVTMSVNNIPNGNDQVGTLKLKSPGVWTYFAPPRNLTATIRATSQEDTTKFATARVTIGGVNPTDRDVPRGRTRRSRT
jgi:hypothetical protein